ncbi:amino acid ABC transporter substrate-binding protein [Desulforhabdus amnigena]|uniref:Amino acid ABC transporter substrate-binding protein n=2 Tax=Desulforhabdus amnigena TaxID=40218 RepID=A0A9W6FSC5_9BACT|nr:ABC transporter substrate-binding protein [Desulforhabdus amnigena]GLI33903.1 amino acid ABC transporter substrate-binding protein [Desulforhabdus amnigena]
MKTKKFFAVFTLIFSLLMAVNVMSCLAEEKTYINGIDANFPPFAFVDKEGNPDGFDVAVINWIAKDMGFKVKHQPMDWDGIIPSLKAKKIDMIASGMSITEARKKEVNFTLPYWKISQVLVAKADSDLTPETAMSEGKKIGVQRGTTEAKWIEENLIKGQGKKFELVYYDSAPLAIEDVINGRIVAAAMDDAPAQDAVKKKPVKILGGFGMPEEEFGYAVRKEDTELLNTLNEGLKKIMASPEWESLQVKYELKK